MKVGRLVLTLVLYVAGVIALAGAPWWVYLPLLASAGLCASWWGRAVSKADRARKEAAQREAHEALVLRVVNRCADYIDDAANETRHVTKAFYFREAAEYLREQAEREAVAR